ncbi:MAG: IS1634 family transposase [Promethearchaeota archaeon]
MFFRKIYVKKDKRKYTYLKLVENHWVKGKVIQEVLVNFGNIDNWPISKVKSFIKKLSAFYEIEPPSFIDEKINHERVLNYGQILLCQKLWDEINAKELIKESSKKLKIKFDISLPVKIMTFNRLIEPKSKLKVSEWYKTQYFRETFDSEIPLQNFYRSLDHLTKIKESLELGLYFQLTNLLTLDLSFVFYDMTSSYFEGNACDISDYGYSRDHRPDRKQINIGLLVNSEGIPLSHQVFRGNVKDTSTVVEIISKLEKRFKINRCIFVGDKGMNSPENIEYLVNSNYEYIFSLKLRHNKKAEEIISKIPDIKEFEKVKDNLFVKELRCENKIRFIVCYNPFVSEKTKQTRKGRIKESNEFLENLKAFPKRGRPKKKEKLKKFIEKSLRKKGTLKFYNIEYKEDSFDYSLNLEKIQKDENLDGLFILQTNSISLTPPEIAIGYKTLAEVEYAFKQIKDFIRLRPIYHYSKTRVEGHVFICFLSYLLEKLISKKLKELYKFSDIKDKYKSPQNVLEKIEPLKAIVDEFEGHTFIKRTKLNAEQSLLLKHFGIENIPSILS